MKRQFLNLLLCGAAILSAGFFSSCKDDTGDLESRISAIELKLSELQATIDKALVTGSSISSWVESADGTHTFTFFGGDLNGQTFSIKPGAGGGSDVTVDTTSEPGFIIITINGVANRIPMGSAVSSLVYRPEFADGLVMLGNADEETGAGAVVRFIATPAPANLDGVTFDIADAYAVEVRPATRAGAGGLLKVAGAAKLVDGYIDVPIKGIGAEAGASYFVSVAMNINGTSIASNYFTVQMTDDFFFDAEEIDPAIKPKDEYSPVAVGDAWQLTVNGLDLLGTVTNFSTLLADGVVPAGAEFVVAPSSAQPTGAAQEKWGILNSSLKADGSWAWSERPGTAFNDNADQKGFLFNIVVADQVVAKIYVTITDDLAAADFAMANANGQHIENNRDEPFHIGVNSYDIAAQINADNFSERHGDAPLFIESFKNYQAKVGESTIIFNDGERLVVSDEGQKWVGNARGLVWLMAQTSIAASQGIGGNGEIIGGWDGITDADAVAMGLQVTPDGMLNTTAAYGGWGMRLGFGIDFEYAYGSKRLGWNIAFIWINRRTCDAEVVDPVAR